MKIIKYLVQNGADIKARDSDGRNVLHYATISNDFSDLIL